MCICDAMGKEKKTHFLPSKSLYSGGREKNNSNIHITYMIYYDTSSSLKEKLHQEDRKYRACYSVLRKAY